MTRVLKGLVALIGLAAMVAGVPMFLITVGGNPLPDRWPGLGELGDLLTSQDTGQLFLGFLLWVAWIAWAYFTVAMLVELAAQLSRRQWKLPVLGGGQRATAGLVTAVVALFVAPTFATVASAAVDHSPAPPSTTIISTQPGRTQTSGLQHSEPAASQPLAATQAAPAAAPVRHSAPAHATTKPYTVKADDTLWGIAEREYGDGLKYRTIAAANPHITDINDLAPGQIIQLPTAPTAKPTTPAGDYTVKKGDTLSEIAEDKLGNAHAWPAIAKANQGQPQPDGGHLTDPDLIKPGWHLTMPAAQTAKATEHEPTKVKPTEPKKVEQGKQVTPPASEKPVKPSTPTSQPTARPTEQPTSTAQPTQPTQTESAPAATPSAEQTQQPATVTPEATDPAASTPQVIQPTLVSAETEPQIAQAGFPIRTAGGAGVLLAAGLVGLLTARKTLQLLHRRPGQAIPAPPAETHTTEAQLRTVAEPLTADRLNLTLRALASALDDADRSLPQLVSVHMSDSAIELRLRTPDHNPPAPFRPGLGAGSWIISVDDVDQLLQSTEVLETMPAPWPTLVTIGHDKYSAHVLVDLEQTAALAITTPTPAVARAVLAAISVELATSTWADDLRVTVVGDLEDLANALGAGRIRYIDGATNLLAALERRADRNRNHLAEAGHTSLSDARLDPDSADALTPEVVLIATDLTDDERIRLTELVTSLPRVAVAAVTATGDPLTEWNLHISSPNQATLEPIGLELQPQMLDGHAYDSVIKLLRAAARTDTEPADWWDHDLEEVAEPTPPEPTAAVVSIAPTPIAPAVEASQARRDAEITHLHAPLDVPQFPPSGPWLQVLGPVEIHGATGNIEQKRSEVCRRLAVFLALHPNGTPGTVIDDTLVITSSYRLSVLSRLRSWLGEAPDGDDYLPAAVGKKYRLHADFRSDWDHFNELIKAGINASPTRNLVEALKLVKGRPMSSGTPQLYSWASYHSDQISAKIRDTALLVAERSLEAHDINQARWAITTAYQAGLQHDEYLARAELRVERAAGNTDGIRAVVDRLNQTVRDLEIDLDPETLELMTEIEQARRRNHA
jgi:LysM repeat protein